MWNCGSLIFYCPSFPLWVFWERETIDLKHEELFSECLRLRCDSERLHYPSEAKELGNM